MRTPLLSIIIVIVLGLVVLSPATEVRAQAEVNLRIDQVDERAFPEVRLFTTVTDSQGRFLPRLSAEQFVLREGERSLVPQELRAVAPEAIALRVVLALDISKSIEPNLEQSKDAAMDFVRSLSPQDEIALVFFGTTARIVQPFTADHGAVINSILELSRAQLEDYTALYNGVFESIRLADDQGSSGRRAVVVVTDGNNTVAPGSDSLSLADVQRSASDRRVPVHAIAVGAEVSVQELRIMATNGLLLQVDQPDQLDAAYKEILVQLRQQYLLSYTSQLPTDGAIYPLELSVNVDGLGSGRADTNIQALLPLIPQLTITLPEELVIGQSAVITVEIVARNQPVVGQLLLDGTSVVTEEVNGPIWQPNWTPSTDLTAGDYTLEVQVTDTLGAIGSSATQPVTLQADGLATGEGVPTWAWIAMGVAATLGFSILGFFLWRRQSEPNYEYEPVQPLSSITPPPIVIPTPPTVATQKPRSPKLHPTYNGENEAAGLAQATLVVERGKATPKQLTLSGGTDLTIGRQPGSGLLLTDEQASAQHAVIRFLEGGFVIADLNSTNGLWVNGQRVDRLRLQDGDQIAIGGTRIIFKQARVKR